MKKNELITITIEDIGVDGEGIGKVDGYTLFVKDAIIGDTVEAIITKAKKNYGYAKMMKILKPSPYRVPAKCPVARKCGGCQIQELSYEAQLEFKTKKVRGNLERIGGFQSEHLDGIMEPICGMEVPFNYRNKAQFPIGTDKEGKIVTGFYAGRTHQIIPNMECALGVNCNQEILEMILDFMNKYHITAYNEETGRGLVRHVLIRYGFKTDEIMVCLVINGDNIPHSEKLVDNLTKIKGMTSITYSINRENTNVIMGKEIGVLWGQRYITDYIGDIQYQISPLSFFQVNPVQTEKLYSLALEYANLKGEETVWDLYCGIGTISLFLAQKAKNVYGVEIIPQAIEDAKNNANINQIANAEFFVGKAEEVLPEQYEKNQVYAEVIVVDPPRKGCDETLLCTMVEMKPERIVYVSCDSATLARDLKYLCENGYELKRVKPVDQFPHTVHVETVALLSWQIDVHKMKLNSAPFEMIKSGEKTIELRLYDEKRQQVKVGDKIVFTNNTTGETLHSTVVKLHRFDNFDELYKTLPLLKCGYTTDNIDTATPADMEQYYSVEEQKKYGVVGIELFRPEQITDETVCLLSRTSEKNLV